jgi:hypothetical protein
MCSHQWAHPQLAAVATVDGTDPNNDTLTWTCPDVSPNGPVFFYQFSSPFAPLDQTAWSSRFTIEGADGTSDPAPSSTQPDGAPTPWGSATLAANVVALPAPTDVGSKVGGAAAATSTSSDSGASSPSGTASGSIPVATTSGSTPSGSASGGPLGVSTASQVSGTGTSTKSAAGSAGSAGTGTNTASAGATSPSNGAVAVRGTSLYALGAVAAFAVLAL